MEFSENTKYEFYLKFLEENRFIMTSEHNGKIIAKSNGIHKEKDGEFLVCLCWL